MNHHRTIGTPMPPEGTLTKNSIKFWGGHRKVTGNPTPKGTPGAGWQMVTGKDQHLQGNKDSVEWLLF